MNQPIKTGKHPKALFVLFFTEMWERFAYYLMVGILLLYMIDTKTGGKGFDEKIGADIVGSFIALVYLTPFIGGLIADRYLGYIKSIFINGSRLPWFVASRKYCNVYFTWTYYCRQRFFQTQYLYTSW